jgi:hypothetical protein
VADSDEHRRSARSGDQRGEAGERSAYGNDSQRCSGDGGGLGNAEGGRLAVIGYEGQPGGGGYIDGAGFDHWSDS